MTELLEKALAAVRKMPPDAQDAVAEAMLSLAEIGSDGAEEIEPDHLAAVLEGLEQAERGELATDEEVAAAFRQFGS